MAFGEVAGRRLVEDDDGLLQLPEVVEVGAAGDGRAVQASEAGQEGLRVLGGERLDVPVAGGDERHPLALPLDDHAGRGGLHATGREARLHLVPEHRRDVPAEEAVEDAAGLLGIDQGEVQLAGVADGGLDRVLGDLVEDHALDGHLRVEHLQEVPRDGLALAVLIRGEQDLVGALERALEFADRLRLAIADDVVRVEVVLDVDGVLAVGLLVLRRDALLVGEVADVPHRAQHLVVVAEVALDRPHLRRGLDDDELLALCQGGILSSKHTIHTPYWVRLTA